LASGFAPGFGGLRFEPFGSLFKRFFASGLVLFSDIYQLAHLGHPGSFENNALKPFRVKNDRMVFGLNLAYVADIFP
jgi:hypothetical protein